MDFLYLFLPAGLAALASKLKAKDANDIGADDAFGNLLMELSPAIPELIKGNVNDNLGDKIFAAIYKVAKTYLTQRGKLPTS